MEAAQTGQFALLALNIFHNLISDALAGFQFNLDLHRLGLFPKFRALDCVPGGGRRWSVARFVVRRGARDQPVFAGGDVAQRAIKENNANAGHLFPGN